MARRRNQKEEQVQLPTIENNKSTVSEAFKALRTNIMFYGLDKPLNSILITSAGPKEGKSFTVANLSVTLAAQGNNVILVDADMRRPRQHKAFNQSRLIGLSSVVSGAQELAEAIVPTEVENLSLLPSGPTPPNPSELLGTQKFYNLLQQLEKMFDIVIVDSPPVLAVTDATVLANQVDGVILVTRSGVVTVDAARQAKQRLQNSHGKLLGVVLNDFDIEQQDYYYYYNYYNSESRD